MTDSLTPTRVKRFLLNPEIRGDRVNEFEKNLLDRIVGQKRAVHRIANAYLRYTSNMSDSTRPTDVLLFLGPTGSGKTRVVEAAAEILFGDAKAVIKIDCAEFQHSHEIAKLIGSPPGYLGHRETSEILSQKNIDRYQTESNKFSFILFDEIEKASPTLWQLLLGILDKAIITLGSNNSVDFSRTIIVMTSNLGAKEMSDLIDGSGIGFVRGSEVSREVTKENLDDRIYHVALASARRKFSPEFMNRIDKVVVFRSLSVQDLEDILEIEINRIYHRILNQAGQKFVLSPTLSAKKFLLKQGTNLKCGARDLKRSLEDNLVTPVSALLMSGQIRGGDQVTVDFPPNFRKLQFMSEPDGAYAFSSFRRDLKEIEERKKREEEIKRKIEEERARQEKLNSKKGKK